MNKKILISKWAFISEMTDEGYSKLFDEHILMSIDEFILDNWLLENIEDEYDTDNPSLEEKVMYLEDYYSGDELIEIAFVTSDKEANEIIREHEIEIESYHKLAKENMCEEWMEKCKDLGSDSYFTAFITKDEPLLDRDELIEKLLAKGYEIRFSDYDYWNNIPYALKNGCCTYLASTGTNVTGSASIGTTFTLSDAVDAIELGSSSVGEYLYENKY